MPPPPPAVLIRTGRPIRSASERSFSTSSGSMGPGLPGGGATPTERATSRALILVAEGFERFGRRTDEGCPCFRDGLGEGAVFAEQAVAGMHGVGAGVLDGGDDGGDVQVAVLDGRRTEPDGLVRGGDVGRGDVGVGKHGDRLQAHPLAGAKHAAGDFSSVGDQDFLEHGGILRGRDIPRQGGARSGLRRAAGYVGPPFGPHSADSPPEPGARLGLVCRPAAPVWTARPALAWALCVDQPRRCGRRESATARRGFF